MRKQNRAAPFVILAASLLFQACATGKGNQVLFRDKNPVKKVAYGSPKDSVLVYGSLWTNSPADSLLGAVGARRNYYANGLQMLQLNPSKPPMVITPARYESTFYTYPLPLGSSIRIFYFYEATNTMRSENFLGLQGRSPADRRLEKPGLCYLGSLVYTDRGYAEKKFGIRDDEKYIYKEYDFFPIGDATELEALKAILPKYKKTEWEPLILDRIKELKK
jgi:hypothetical protein